MACANNLSYSYLLPVRAGEKVIMTTTVLQVSFGVGNSDLAAQE